MKWAPEIRTEGTIVSLKDGIVRIYGLNDVMLGEMIEFPGGVYGVALNLERDSVGAVVLGAYEHLAEGQTVNVLDVFWKFLWVKHLLGRVVDALGNPIDGKGPINTNRTSPIEKVAPGVIARQSVTQPLQTGLNQLTPWFPLVVDNVN